MSNVTNFLEMAKPKKKSARKDAETQRYTKGILDFYAKKE
jgi:hypothetical protein